MNNVPSSNRFYALKWMLAVGAAVMLPLCRSAADTITLKDGTVVEGTIVKQESGQVFIRVAIAGGTIFQTRAFNLSDVASIKVLSDEERRQQKMQRDFEQLQQLRLHPTQSYRLEDYDLTIKNRFMAFLSEFPDSPHKETIRNQMQAWQAERERVAAGMVKVDGNWLTREQFTQQTAQVRSQQILNQARGLVANGQYVNALRVLEDAALNEAGEHIQAESRKMVADIYAVWYPQLDRRLTELPKEIQHAREQISQAERERDQAQAAMRIQTGFRSGESGSGVGQIGKGSETGQAAVRLNRSLQAIATWQSTLSRLQQEQQFVQTQIQHARANAERLGITSIIARVEEFKQPSSDPAAPADHQQEIIARHTKQLSPDKDGTPGILIDLTRWSKDNWPWVGGLLLIGLFLLYKYVIA